MARNGRKLKKNTNNDDSRTREKMSFDFLAPSHKLHSPQKMFLEETRFHAAVYATPVSAWLEQNLTARQIPSRGEQIVLRHDSGGSDLGPHCDADSEISAETPTSQGTFDISIQDAARSDHRRRVDDRHNYDEEEKFAILWLRIVREEKWTEVLRHFHILFPPDVPRRQAGKGLTARYFRRRKGGLECRYYRLREDLYMKPLRSVEYDSANDRAVLARMHQTAGLSNDFLERLRLLGD
ncbi:hypothetical protein NA57DRAFT_54887 [Rhizodiscina lignyota]|uniref:Uncharacterized protein n=1 Tax=Rhizodiscina lignyota TaxID=1504668 RepID=A0A9P4IGX8_9PEZI|nr:hypothetical protein NA57DRAFT_54887 [Rhizodiscina lignyota]